MARLAIAVRADEGDGIVLEVARHGPVAVQRQIAGQRVDLDGRAEGERPRAERAVDLGIGVDDGVEGAPADIGLEPRLAGDHVHLRAAVGQNRMNADRVLVPEGLAERIDRHEPDLRGVERIDAHVRRAAGMGRPPDVADELADAAVVRQRHRRAAVLRARRRVDHHRQVHVVEVAEPHQFGLAPEELERARRALAHPPLEVAALLCGHGEEHHAARQVRHHAGVVKRHRRAQHPRHLRIVAARVRRPREGIRRGMPRHRQRVELADERKRRPRALAPRHLRPHPREREPRPRRQPDSAQRLLDELRGLHLLESQLRTPPDPLPDPDDVRGSPIHRLQQPPLQLLLGL